MAAPLSGNHGLEPPEPPGSVPWPLQLASADVRITDLSSSCSAPQAWSQRHFRTRCCCRTGPIAFSAPRAKLQAMRAPARRPPPRPAARLARRGEGATREDARRGGAYAAPSLWAPSGLLLPPPSNQRTPPRTPGRSLDGFPRPAAWLRAGAAPRQGRRRVPLGCQDPGVGGHGRGGQRARRWAVERRRMGAAVGRVRGGGGDGGRDLEHVTHVIQVGRRPDRPDRHVPDRLMVCRGGCTSRADTGPRGAARQKARARSEGCATSLGAPFFLTKKYIKQEGEGGGGKGRGAPDGGKSKKPAWCMATKTAVSSNTKKRARRMKGKNVRGKPKGTGYMLHDRLGERL